MQRCDCCGAELQTGGCLVCKSIRTFCGCGALLACGCGRQFTHQCPNVIVATEPVPASDAPFR